MPTVVVTGASGFIGSHFVKLAEDAGWDVRALVRNGEFADSKLVRYFRLDENLEETLSVVTSGADAIVHAAYDSIDLKWNIDFLKFLCKLCNDNKIKKFINISTFVVFDLDQKVITESSKRTKLIDPYIFVKEKCLKVVNSIRFEFTSVFNIFPTIVFGDGANWSNVAKKIIKNSVIRIPAAGQKNCNSIHVDDLCAAMIGLIESDRDQKIGVSNLLISNQASLSWSQFYLQEGGGVNTSKFECAGENSNKYHENNLKNLIFSIVFSRKIFWLIFPIFSSFNRTYKSKKQPLQKVDVGSVGFSGSSRWSQLSDAVVDASKVRNEFRLDI